NAGEWRNRPDGLAELVVPVNYAAQSELAALREELARKDVVIEELMQSNGDMTTCLKSAERHEPHCLLLDPEEPDCNCNCVVSRLTAAEQRNLELVELLDENQWRWQPYDDYDHTEAGYYCIQCYQHDKSGHAADCKLAAALKPTESGASE